MNVLELIEPYTKTIKPGFYQTRYNDLVFNFDEGLRFWFTQVYLPFHYNHSSYCVNTGYPRLDDILIAIINDDSSTFPAFTSPYIY